MPPPTTPSWHASITTIGGVLGRPPSQVDSACQASETPPGAMGASLAQSAHQLCAIDGGACVLGSLCGAPPDIAPQSSAYGS